MHTEPSPWRPYEPSAAAPWDLRRVVHLHRRAAFGATHAELQQDLTAGPAVALTRLLRGERRVGVPAEFDALSTMLAESARLANDPQRLAAWWLWRMLVSPDPLGERLALLWHDHFATSQLKVMDLGAMRRQNEHLRRDARAPFATLLLAVVRDPAMLVWLDANANRKAHPNENLARELMELFTLGEGRYSERDVQEVARALTGYSVTADGAVHFAAAHHDDGEKTILGVTAHHDLESVLALLVAQPATAIRLARRLCAAFLRPELVTEETVASLAATLRESSLDVGRAVELVLRSERFFSAENLGGVVLGPVQWLMSLVRGLELLEPLPSTLLLAEWCARLGQELFFPPTVFGWEGGRAWITTGSLLGRARCARELVSGVLTPRTEDPLASVQRHGALPDVLARVFFGLESADTAAEPLARDAAIQLANRFFAAPKAQLG